jgi:hypothetical protein
MLSKRFNIFENTYFMEGSSVSLIISVVALFIAILSFYQSRKNKRHQPSKEFFNTIPLQLQAYERLVMLTERIALPNLISRVSQPQYTAKEMQMVLLDNIKQEFEYNSSQQIYVSRVAWEAVRNLKDQNMITINQVANVLHPESRAHDLNKQLLEIILNQKEKDLHAVVLDTLNYEAKEIMNR